jgi:hypothetical protein
MLFCRRALSSANDASVSSHFGICASVPDRRAAATSAVITGLTSGNLGLALRAGLISAVTVFAMNAVGDFTGHKPVFGSGAHIANMAGHAAVGCAAAAASGGSCKSGAMAGAAGSFGAPLIGGAGLGMVGGTAASAVLGGLASVAGGGKFGNGAVTAAFGYLYNELGSNAQRGYGDDGNSWLAKAFLGMDAEATLRNYLQSNYPLDGWTKATVFYPDGTWGFIDLLRGSEGTIFEVKPIDGWNDGGKQLQNYAAHSNYTIGSASSAIGSIYNVPSTGPFAFLGAVYDFTPTGTPGVEGWYLRNPGQVAATAAGAAGFVAATIAASRGNMGGRVPAPAPR